MQKISGEVIHGKKLGRTIGYPTANVALKKGILADGVYNSNVVYNGTIHKAAGVYRENIELLEAYIFDFSEDLYGQTIDIYILEKIRENQTVSSLEAVKKLIDNDVKIISENHNYVLTFGTFDLVHDGHIHYLREAKKYGDKLVTIVATDKNVEKLKGTLPKNTQTQRIQDVKNTQIADLVTLGGETSHLDWLTLYAPKIVCLGYDQVGFSEQLRLYIQKNNLDISVIRMAPYKPEVYKSSKLKQK